MSFPSKYASLLWDSIYQVEIPDVLSLDPEYIKIFGVHVTGDKDIDGNIHKTFTTVMISPIKMLEYFDRGLEIRIPNREDMIKIHKDIELYLGEWRDHLKYDINLSVSEHKDLITNLEKMSKTIYGKAKNKEVIDNLFVKKQIGLVNPLTRIKEERNPTAKPDYEGIASLVRSKVNKPLGRF